MAWKSFAAGVAVTAIVAVVAGVGVLRSTDDMPIVMGQMDFFDLGRPKEDAGFVTFSGQMGGREKVSPANNEWSGTCTRAEMTCRVLNVGQIAPHQLSAINSDDYKVVSWETDRIVAELTGSAVCVNSRLVIDRVSKQVQYQRINLHKPDKMCQDLDKRDVITWDLVDGFKAASARAHGS